MDLVSGWCRSKRELIGTTAIVTGCNTGIGKETVKDFYCRGARVIMACRDTQKAEAAKSEILSSNVNRKGELIVEKLDLARLSSVKEFAKKMLIQEPGVRILVNNAGVMMVPEGKTEDGLETHIATNHFGHALLTLLLLPRLKRNTPSRVVFVSSLLHARCKPNFDDINFETTSYDPVRAYSQSKAANIIFANVLAQKLKEANNTGVTTYSLHPGVIGTDIGRHFSETYFNGATWLFDNVLAWFAKSPRCGAQTTIYCSLDEKCENESGLYYSDCAVSTMSKHCRKEELALKLWDLTIGVLHKELLTSFDPFGDIDPVL